MSLPTVLQAAILAATLASNTLAMGQTSYSYSSLQQLSSGVVITPTNKVIGDTKYLVRITFEQTYGLLPVPVYGFRSVSWNSSTTASVSPVNNFTDKSLGNVSASPNGDYLIVKGNSGVAKPQVSKGGKLLALSLGTFWPSLINNNGQMLGNTFSAPVYWSNGQATTLPYPGYAWASGTALNSQGVVVGWVTDANNRFHAARWTNGSLDWVQQDAGNGSSMAQSINDAGQMLVKSTVITQGYETYPDENGVPTQVPVDIPSVQWSVVNNDGKAQILSLGKANVTASGINASGTVVGTAAGRAVLWKNGVEIDLNALAKSKGAKLPIGSTLKAAYLINDAGSVVVMGSTSTCGDCLRGRLAAKP